MHNQSWSKINTNMDLFALSQNYLPLWWMQPQDLWNGWRVLYVRGTEERQTFLLLQVTAIFVTFIFQHSSFEKSGWEIDIGSVNTNLLPPETSCLDRRQMFPPGWSIWCNNRKIGPTARPSSIRGGHLCCRDADFCNGHLKPEIVDYSLAPHSIFAKGDVVFFASFVLLFCLFGSKRNSFFVDRRVLRYINQHQRRFRVFVLNLSNQFRLDLKRRPDSR